MLMLRSTVALFATLSASVVVLACTVTTTNPGPGESSNSGGTNEDAGESSSGTSGTSGDGTGDGGGTGDGRCKKEATNNACTACCVAAHKTGNTTFDDAVIACACGGTGACQTECVDLACATPPVKDPPPTTPCGQCLTAALSEGGDCVASTQAACQEDDDCVALVQCVQSCPAD